MKAAYAQYLRSPAWAQKRAEALERAGGHCAVCGLPKAHLNAHHRHYKTLGQEEPEDLVVMCPRCHLALEIGQKILEAKKGAA